MKRIIFFVIALIVVGASVSAESPYNPYDRLPPAATFSLTSSDIPKGEIAKTQMGEQAGGKNQSPELKWSGFPKATKSFVVTMFDADAPTPSGLWHWAVADIPASVTELPTGAGVMGGASLPKPAFQLPNDIRLPLYIGAAPPPGQTHRYFIVVYAVDVASLGIPADATPAYLNLSLLGHTLARATLVATAKN